MAVVLPEIGLGCANLLGAPLPELIDVAERNGFRRISANPGALAAALRDGWTEAALRRRLDDAGISVTMIDALANDSLPGVAPAALPPGWEPTDEAMCFRSAEVLRCQLLNLTHYPGDPSTPLAALVPAVAAACERAAGHGRSICLEFVPGTAMPDLGAAWHVVEASGPANVGILLDLFHHARSGGTVDDIVRLPPGAISAVQLSDRVAPPPGTPHVPLTGRVLPGDGELPVLDLVVAALRNNPGATVDIEVLNPEVRAMTPDEAGAHLAAGIRRWRDHVAGAQGL